MHFTFTLLYAVCCWFVSGNLSEMEYDVLTEWFKHLVHSPDVHVKLFGNLYSLLPGLFKLNCY